MGTTLQTLDLTAQDFGGPEHEGCNENLVITRPDVIRKVHEGYLRAGCDIVLTNTFGATPLVLAEFGLSEKADEINFKAAALARAACDGFTTSDKPRFVAGSIGPTTKAMTVTGGVTFDELTEHYLVQARGLQRGGADFFLFETCQDGRNIKAGMVAIDRLAEETGKALPIAVSVTIEPMGTMLAGQTVEAVYASLAHRDLLYLGLNCATGPDFMTDHLRSLSALCHFPVACVPNAGLPDEEGRYPETAEMLARTIARFMQNGQNGPNGQSGWINLVGGCCGTDSTHIRALSELAARSTPRPLPARSSKASLSGVDFLEVTDDLRPVLVGERTNVIGSRKFKQLIVAGQWDEASEIAKTQVRHGAQIIDVCLANPDRDELDDVRTFLEHAVKKIRAPMMIDSTDSKVIELALTYSQGKAIINSINLEDGEERFESVIPIGNRFGAAYVVGTIDEDPVQGMGVSRQRKLEIAERSFTLLTEKYGVRAEDIYFDPLVFPCGTGDAQYVGSALETVEGLRLIKARFPQSKTVLGISNVSFGLPPEGRECLNSVFLHHCVKAGLDLAIVNTEKLERYASIAEEDKTLSEDLLFNRNPDAIARFTEHFRKRGKQVVKPIGNLSLDERLAHYIVDGTKEGLVADLDEKLKTTQPLAIINGPLMKGMDEVGRLFNDNKLIVAEVLQSAESMKAAVNHLKPHIDKQMSGDSTQANTSLRGKVILATVKGDVHDIGKNLVEIILGNNGFHVVNLGIKVLPETLIQAIREHKPDIVGLSGLLVKSAQQMVTTAQDFSTAGITTPMLCGGAALSERFVDLKIAANYTGTVLYAKDAMQGLDLAKQIRTPDGFERLKKTAEERRAKIKAALSTTKDDSGIESRTQTDTRRSKTVRLLDARPRAPDFKRHVIQHIPVDQLYPFINPLMLYTRHLGIRGGVARKLDQARSDRAVRTELQENHAKEWRIFETIEALKTEYRSSPLLAPRAVYQFLPVRSVGNAIHHADTASKTPIFEFLRQTKEDGLCLSDYVHTQEDSVALFVTTVGRGLREHVNQLKDSGEFLKSHVLQALAIESAEAFAEFLHAEIRKWWGFPDPSEMTMMQRFQAQYQGKRYSFGYPACPRLDDQTQLFDILKPEEIGVQLTEGFMMDPEASVSAIAFHHPQATYFSVGQDPLGQNENRF